MMRTACRRAYVPSTNAKLKVPRSRKPSKKSLLRTNLSGRIQMGTTWPATLITRGS